MSTSSPWEKSNERNRQAEERKQERRMRAKAADPDRASPEEEGATSDDEDPGN